MLLAQDRTGSPMANIRFGRTPGRRTRASRHFELLPLDNLKIVDLGKAVFEWVTKLAGGRLGEAPSGAGLLHDIPSLTEGGG